MFSYRMKSLTKIVLVIASIVSGILTLIVLGIYVKLLMWDYNEEGNHFDVETATNYTDNGVAAFGLLTVFFLVITIMLVLVTRRLSR